MTVIAVPIALMVYALVRIGVLWRKGDLRRGLTQVLFLPGRQVRVFLLLVTIAVSTMLTAIMGSLAVLGTVSIFGADIADAALFYIGAFSLFFLMTVGFRPKPLTETERAAVRAGTLPFSPMGLLPFLDPDSPPPRIRIGEAMPKIVADRGESERTG